MGEKLAHIVDQYRLEMNTIHRLSRRYPRAILDALVYTPSIVTEDLQNEAFMQQWVRTLQRNVDARLVSEGMTYKVTLETHKERNAYLPVITVTTHGVESFFAFNVDFFSTSEYHGLVALGQTLDGLLEVGAYITRGERKMPVSDFRQALEWLMAEAKKGQQIQRYKGLGEMNPDQLWETTMDPNVRRMLRVKIEDAVAADALFTCLMGDNVESRRDFIETNALQVENLDI